MRKFVAMLFVPVAFIAAATPTLASSGSSVRNLQVGDTVLVASTDTQQQPQGYWTAKSEYLVSDGGAKVLTSGARPKRRVMITGYHPLAGFEAETAQEAAAAGY